MPPRAPRVKTDRRRADFEASQARIRRVRSLVGVLGFIPLGISLFCGSGGSGPCGIPREIYLGLWAAIFGTFLGLTVRLWRERRAFEREMSAA